MDRLEEIVARLPQAERVDVEAWDGEPTFRVNGKTFIFSSPDASGISVKLPKEEAAAVVATDPNAAPTGYGLGRHGWISVSIPATTSATAVEGDRGVDPHLLHAGRTQEAGPSGPGGGPATRVT